MLGIFEILRFIFIYGNVLSTQIVAKLFRNWNQIRDEANDFRTVEVFLAKYLTSKSGGDYTEIEL